jgi:MFS family permease
MLLSFLFLYLNSIFRFILFDSVLRRECSISDGWRKWQRAGGRFLLWQIVLQLATWIFFALLVGVPVAFALAAGWATDLRSHIGRLIIGAIFGFGLLLLFFLTIGVVQVLAKDFLVPIMALEGLDFADGWHRLLAIIRPDQGRFAVYLLLKFVLSIAAGIIFTIAAVIPALLMAVPAIVAVVAARTAGLGWNVTTISLTIIFGSMLFLAMIYLIALVCVPATVFFPAYALYFFAARYPNLEVLLNPVPVPAPVPQPPPLPQSAPPLEIPPLPPSAEPIG